MLKVYWSILELDKRHLEASQMEIRAFEKAFEALLPS